MISQLVNALLVRVHGANVSGFIANIYCSFSRNNRLYPELCGFCCSHSALYRGRCELRLAYRRTLHRGRSGASGAFQDQQAQHEREFRHNGNTLCFRCGSRLCGKSVLKYDRQIKGAIRNELLLFVCKKSSYV